MIYETIISTIVASVSATESDVVDLGNRGILGLILPTIVSGNITFNVAANPSDTPVEVKGADGSAISITAGEGAFAVSSDDLAELAAYRWIQIVTAGTQTSESLEFIWVLKG